MQNLYKMGLLRDGKINEEDIRGESFSTIYDGKAVSTATYGRDSHTKIMKNFANQKRKDFKKKYGLSEAEYIEKMELNQRIYESQIDFLHSLAKIDGEFKMKSTSTRSSIKKVSKAKKRTDEERNSVDSAVKNLKEWSSLVQEYMNVMSSIKDTFVDKHGMESPKLEGVPRSLLVDPAAVSAYKQLDLLIEDIEKKLEKIAKDGSKFKRTNFIHPQVSKGKFVTNSRGRKVNKKIRIDKLMSNAMGSISLIKGAIFEAAIANALYDEASDIVKEVYSMGAEKGAVVEKGDNTMIEMKRSKTDVAFKDKNSLVINISAKNQPSSKEGGVVTSLLATNLARYIALVHLNDLSSQKLIGLIETNRKEINKSGELNLFFSAIIADLAIGSGDVDRIDFIAFNDEIIGLSDYYELIIDKMNIRFGKVGEVDTDILTGKTSLDILKNNPSVQVREK